MLERLPRTSPRSVRAALPSLTCALLTVALVASAAAPKVPSPAAWSELEFRVLESDADHTVVEVLIPAPEFRSVQVQDRTFDAIRVPGASPMGEPGEPLMCVAGTLIAIPPESGVELRVLEEGHDVLGGIVPVPGRDAEWTPNQPLVIDEGAYSKHGFSLPQAEVGDPAIMRDYRVVPLRVFPLSYDAATHELRVTRRLLVELDYSGQGRVNIKTTNRPPSRAFRSLYERSIANYDFVRTRYESDSRGKYLIITHDNFYDSILPLAEWKHKQGMEVEIANTAVIGGSTSQIKTYIQNAYDNWDVPPEYILIVGDSEYVPTSDSDNYYGQLEGGDVLVDVNVGRFTCDNTTECDLMVAKTLGYERTPFMSHLDWFRSGCLIVREDYDSGDSIYFGDAWFIWNLMEDEGFTQVDTLFRRNGSDRNDVHAAITEGRAFLNYRGQGVTNWWSPFDCNPNLTDPGYKLPVLVAATCASGGFTGDGYPCEAWFKAGTVASPKGSVASLGTSIVGSHVSQYRSAVDQGFFDGIFNLDMHTIGEALTNGKLNLHILYPSVPYEYLGWNCQGDPELDAWTGIPRYLDVSYPPAVQTGPSTLDINVADGGAPIEDALVCAYMPDQIYETGYTDAGGDVSFDIDPATPDTIWITVTGHNLHPHEGHIVVAADGPYLAYAGHEADDSNTGNNDGVITPGETIELSVSLENIGPEDAVGVSGVLRSRDSYAAPGDSTASYGEVPIGGTVTNARPYTFTVGADCPNGQELDLTVRATDSSSRGHWNINIPDLEVSAADLSLTSSVVNDETPGGDGDGTLEPGETTWLDLTVENAGPLALAGVSGTLSTSDPYAAVTDAGGEFGDIAADGGTGSSAANSFRVSVSPIAPPAHDVTLTLTLEGDGDTYTHTQSMSFDVPIGGVPSSGPSGPDDYGYYAYDDGDAWTGQAPNYSWVEITGLSGNPGNELTELDEDAGVTTIPLPFTFKYYGVDYTEISICSNGFLAMGAEDYHLGNNSGIPDIDGPEAMIAPFWMDLNPAEGGAIFEKYESASHRWICQFDDVVQNGGLFPETFEVILYDPAYQSNPGGIGDIVIQYQEVHSPFACTVGIENPAETTGIQYLYNSTYDPAAAQLHAGQALRFTTALPQPAAQWLAVSDTGIDDSVGGNGDGQAQPLESVSVLVTLENLGSDTATGVSGTLTTSDPDVSINVGTSTFGDIASGATGDNSSSPFRVTVAESPSDEYVELDLHVSSSDSRYDAYDIITVVLDLSQTGIGEGTVPSVFALRQNSPNPFSEGTRMSFSLPSPERVKIGVYSVAGRRIATVCDADYPAGEHSVGWDGRDSGGRPVAAGIYFYRIVAGTNTDSRKMIVLK